MSQERCLPPHRTAFFIFLRASSTQAVWLPLTLCLPAHTRTHTRTHQHARTHTHALKMHKNAGVFGRHWNKPAGLGEPDRKPFRSGWELEGGALLYMHNELAVGRSEAKAADDLALSSSEYRWELQQHQLGGRWRRWMLTIDEKGFVWSRR